MSGTARVSRYRKGKTNLDFTEARDSEWQWHQLDHMQVCTAFQTDNHANTSPLKFFYRPDALPIAEQITTNATSALRLILQRIGVTWMNFFTVLACVRRSVTAGCGVVRTHRPARPSLLHHDHLLRRHHRHLLRARHPPRRPEHQGQAGRRRGGPPSADHRRLPRPHQVSVHACTVGRQQ